MEENTVITTNLIDISDEITPERIKIVLAEHSIHIYADGEEFPRLAVVKMGNEILVSIYPEDIWEDVTTYNTYKGVDKGEK